MNPESIIQLIAILCMLFLSAFFSSSETALTTANRVRLKALADEGNKNAIIALKVLDKYSKMLSAILIGNNVVNISASALATTLAIGINLQVGIATAVLTIVVLIFCEIMPKSITATQAEKMALLYAGIINVIMFVLTPVIAIMDAICKGIMKMLRIDPNARDAMTETELRTYVDVGHEDGAIERKEKEMIINVVDFGDSVAKDLMIPRIDMVSVSTEATYDEIMAVFKECMYTRIPVFEQDNDNIIGLINMKDFIGRVATEDFDIHKLLRAGYYTYEYKKTADLLSEMRKKRESVAFVLNEYGGCEGMVTLEDLLEEIVGEIRDEYDGDEENLIQKMEANTYMIEGSVKLADINDELGTNLDSEDYDSIAGLVIEYLGDNLPEDGESIVTKEGYELKVHGVSQNRIQKVILTLTDEDEENLEGEEEVL